VTEDPERAADGHAGRFERGDHLRVRRPLGYDHHGIYVNDQRVIQFGGRILDKPHASIEAVALDQFERSGTAEVVRHGDGAPAVRLRPADPQDAIVERAEFLLAHRTHVPSYNLLGNNCEHAATWCVNRHRDSHQIQFFHLTNSVALLLLYSTAARRTGRLSPAVLRTGLAITVGGIIVRIITETGGFRWLNRIDRKWTGTST
jgi:hypothetical protein